MESLREVFSRGSRFGLRMHFDGKFWRIDCHVMDGTDVRTVVVGAVHVAPGWEKRLLHVVVSLLSCFNSLSGLCVVVVGDHLSVGRALVSVATTKVRWILLVCWSASGSS